MRCQRPAAAGPGAPGAPAGRQRRLAGGPPGGLRPLRRALRPAGDPGRAADDLFPFRPPPADPAAARRPRHDRGEPPRRVRRLQRESQPDHRGGGAGGLLRLRQPLGARRRVGDRRTPGELLPGDLPLPVRARHGGLLRPHPRPPQPSAPSPGSGTRRSSSWTSTGSTGACTSTPSRSGTAILPRCSSPIS